MCPCFLLIFIYVKHVTFGAFKNIFAFAFLQCEIDGEIEYEFPCYNRENFDGMWWNANDQVKNLKINSDKLGTFLHVCNNAISNLMSQVIFYLANQIKQKFE